METLGSAHLPTHSIVFHSGLGIIYEESIWCCVCWYVLTADNSSWLHPSNSLHRAGVDPRQCRQCQQTSVQPCHCRGGGDKKTFCLFSLRQIDRHTLGGVARGCGWVEVKGRDNVSNRETLRSVSGSRKASRKQQPPPPTQMTNVHRAFPIPLLSARTNASCLGVRVCKDLVTR